MSFVKKLNSFLLDAKSENVISEETYQNIKKFSDNRASKSGVNSFVASISGVGGFAIILGLILIVSHNWREISDFTKIAVYALTLVGFHAVGILLSKNYPKTSSAFHFIGAGYVIAGIGLVAQIYHLSSEDGKSFLLWFAMICPIAILLKNKWIGAMSAFAFYWWVGAHIEFYNANEINSLTNCVIYFTAFALNLILIPKIFERINNPCFNFVKIFGIFNIAVLMISLGFLHNIKLFPLGEPKPIPLMIMAMLVVNILALSYIFVTRKKEDDDGFYSKNFLFLFLITQIIPLGLQTSTISAISFIYWILAASFGFILIYQGSIYRSISKVNFGVRYLLLFAIIRFIDLFGSMLTNGVAFIIFGAVLIGIAFLAEKYRKNLINKISLTHANG